MDTFFIYWVLGEALPALVNITRHSIYDELSYLGYN